MKKQSKELVPPDGGWGWMVCLGSSLITLSLRSLDPSFGLLFGDLLRDLRVDTAGASVVMSVLDAVFSFSGMFVGPLLKRFTGRKVAIFGSLLSCTGLLLTSQANSLIYIICTYSILGGLGTGIATTASFVSLNSYFKERRTQFVGLSMVGTAVGMMCMPQIVHLLLKQYDFRGTVLIVTAIALHAVVGSILFQPVAWHLKPAPNQKELKKVSNGALDEKDALLKSKKTDEDEKLRKVSLKSNVPDMSSIDVTENHWKDDKTSELKCDVGSCVITHQQDIKKVSNGALDEGDTLLKSKKTNEDEKLRKISLKSNALDISSIDVTENHWKDDKTTQEVRTSEETGTKIDNEKKAKNSLTAKLVKFFDLNLLNDPIFLNIVVGMSFQFQADMNFKFITPFFLKSIGMPEADIAFCLSLVAFSDLFARLTMPTIFTKLKLKNRNVLWTSFTLLSIVRFVIAELMPSKILIMFLMLNGFLRGTAMTNFNLTIAEYCSFGMLPSALGIANVSRGVFVVILGPIVGYIRDVTGSYQISIRMISSFIVISSVMWAIEFIVMQIRMRRSNSAKGSRSEVP